VIVAFTVSPLTALLTSIAFFIIQQVEGNYLMLRIHGHALHVQPIPIVLAMIVGLGPLRHHGDGSGRTGSGGDESPLRLL